MLAIRAYLLVDFQGQRGGYARLNSPGSWDATLRYERPLWRAGAARVVGVDEVDAARGRVSWVSPIARALLKARAGDVVTLRAPGGDETIEILEVSYP